MLLFSNVYKIFYKNDSEFSKDYCLYTLPIQYNNIHSEKDTLNLVVYIRGLNEDLVNYFWHNIGGYKSNERLRKLTV